MPKDAYRKGSGASASGPDSFLGYTIARLAHVMQRRIDEALKREVDLSVRQFGVLAHLAADPGIGAGQLARLVMITAQSMGPLLDSLEHKGLIERDRTAAKGLRVAVRLTRAGTTRLESAYAVAERLSSEDNAGLTEREAQDLNQRLLGILHRLSAQEPDSA